MKKIKNTYKTTVGGVETTYYKKGKGKKLIILPGWRTDIDRIQDVLSYFAENFETYYLNLPGYGDPKYNKPYSYKDIVAFVNEWITSLNLDKYILMGMSMSGPLAYYISKLPTQNSKIEKVILFAPWYKKECINIENKEMLFGKVLANFGHLPGLRSLGQNAFNNEGFMMKFVRHFNKEIPWNEELRRYAKNFENFNFRISCATMKSLMRENLDNESESVNHEAIFIMSKNDTQLDFNVTYEGFKRLFPNMKLSVLKHSFHAPRVWVSRELVEHYFGNTLKDLFADIS
ncbi:alpha/beta hydrolase [Patescibacteria group bacterium]